MFWNHGDHGTLNNIQPSERGFLQCVVKTGKIDETKQNIVFTASNQKHQRINYSAFINMHCMPQRLVLK